ncbi:hypothetical protein FIBSPDRAFT_870471 [Athelia psychrophila]|uniref:Uncharacterized protein n=1 Tax=Athelia psychrophila TaxID=1759441 RepID=A0A166B0J8_9AGAM|nr:hypothetical protein FIBSPDRAFT_870471 [Fibularhizoctonia sp. CBS 109695]
MVNPSQHESIVSVLRIHRIHQDASSSTDEAVDRLVKAVLKAATWSRVIITYDAADSALEHAITTRPELARCREQQSAEFLGATPWSCSGPLNAGVIRARRMGASKIVFMSVEMTVLPEEIGQMLNLWRRETLVIGKALAQHKFVKNAPGLVEVTGLTTPWNTFAIWDLNKLAKTGFILAADTNVAPGQSAIEEVPIVALHQHLYPNDSEATLLKFPDAVATAGWDTTWTDPKRAAWQASKMASKDYSAQSHLSVLNLLEDKSLPKSGIRHIDLSR